MKPLVEEPVVCSLAQDVSTVERAVILVEYEDYDGCFAIGAPDGMNAGDATVFADGLLKQWKADHAHEYPECDDTPSPYKYLTAHGFTVQENSNDRHH